MRRRKIGKELWGRFWKSLNARIKCVIVHSDISGDLCHVTEQRCYDQSYKFNIVHSVSSYIRCLDN